MLSTDVFVVAVAVADAVGLCWRESGDLSDVLLGGCRLVLDLLDTGVSRSLSVLQCSDLWYGVFPLVSPYCEVSLLLYSLS